jgi:hypothetical protein
MTFADLSMDGDYNLIIADIFDLAKTAKLTQSSRKIKVYKGTIRIHEFVIEDRPVGLVTVFDILQTPHLPVVAVAVGNSVVYFKDFSPHLRFDLPLIEYSEQESSIWADLIKLTSSQFNSHEDATESSQEMDQQTMPTLLEKLFALREEEKGLSAMSVRLLAHENQVE